MKNLNIFQIVVLGIFAVLIVVGMLAFSGKLPLPEGAKDVNYGSVTVWGTLPSVVMESVIAEGLKGEKNITIKY